MYYYLQMSWANAQFEILTFMKYRDLEKQDGVIIGHWK